MENVKNLCQFKGAMSHTAHVREEALHLENVRQLFQVLRVIQYQEFIVFYLSHPLTVRIVIHSLLFYSPLSGQLRKSTEQQRSCACAGRDIAPLTSKGTSLAC